VQSRQHTRVQRKKTIWIKSLKIIEKEFQTEDASLPLHNQQNVKNQTAISATQSSVQCQRRKMNYVETVFFDLFFVFCTSNSAERTFSAVSTPPIARNGVSFPVQSLPIDVQKRNRHPGRTTVPRLKSPKTLPIRADPPTASEARAFPGKKISKNGSENLSEFAEWFARRTCSDFS
jgi:hypothetical protein